MRASSASAAPAPDRVLLADYGVAYRETALDAASGIDLAEVRRVLEADRTVKVVFVQRSKGYQDRRTLPAREIDELYGLVKSVSDAYVVVDNNYGEFCEIREPKGDLLCGSLSKTPAAALRNAAAIWSAARRRWSWPPIG